MENVEDLICLFEEIASEMDTSGGNEDFVEIRFAKEEIKRLINCLKELKVK